MNDMIKRKDTKHMIVPFDDQTAVCRTARTVVWEGLALRVSPYPIFCPDYLAAMTSTSTKAPFGMSLTATQDLAGLEVKYSP